LEVLLTVTVAVAVAVAVLVGVSHGCVMITVTCRVTSTVTYTNCAPQVIWVWEGTAVGHSIETLSVSLTISAGLAAQPAIITAITTAAIHLYFMIVFSAGV